MEYKKVYIIAKTTERANQVLQQFKKQFRSYIIEPSDCEAIVHGAKIKAITYHEKELFPKTRKTKYINADDFLAICYMIKCQKLEEIIKNLTQGGKDV